MAGCSWGKSWFDLFKRDAPTVVPTAHRYLKLARECMRHVRTRRVSTSLQFNHGQCEYLVDKLYWAVQTADVWAERNSSELNSECHEIMKSLWRSAREIESFVQGCCKEEWIEAAMVLANMSAYVSSLGHNLELCTFLLEIRINRGHATEAEDRIVQQLDALRVRASEVVKERVSRDQRNLLTRLGFLDHSSNVGVQGSAELAECLAGRLSQHLSGSVQLSVWEIQHSSLRQVHRLGSGAVGMVFRSICWTGRIEVAEKVFYGSDHRSFVSEVEILAGLAHPNITPFLGYATDDRRSSMVMELMDGDLLFLMNERVRERLRENSTWEFPFTTPEAVDIMLQTAEGMLYLHEKRVVHGDLKSQNILVKSRKDIDVEYVFIKVADFGLSKTKESGSAYFTQTPNTGSTRWMAPELMTLRPGEVRYTFKADVYCFGMVCYEILTGKVPFDTITVPRDVKRMVLNGARPILPGHCPNELQMLIHSCWEGEVTRRPSFAEICKSLRLLKWLLMIGVKPRSLAVTAPIGNGVSPLPLAQIDEAYRASVIEPADDGPAELASSQIDVEAYLAPFPPIQIEPAVQTAHRYLELARECMVHARGVSTSLNFNRAQCEYLVDKLNVAVQTAGVWAQFYEFNSEYHQSMKIIWRSAKEIESFVQGCCKEEWIEAAMVLANMSAYVSSLGSNLESCIFLLGDDTKTAGAAPNTTEDWIVQQLDVLRVCESEDVKERVSRDQRNLLTRLGFLDHSSSVSVQGSAELAECLAGRLSQHLSGSVQLSVWEIQHSSLRQVQRLGSGAVGMVYRSICWTGRIEVAEKVFYGSDHPSFVNEVEILAGLAHPNITPLLGYAADDSRSSIVMELMDGDLLFLMKERVRERLRENSTWEFPFTTPEAVDIMLQTAEGMLYLHEKRVVHGDLKSQNILVKSRKEIDVEYVFIKVADFGLSKTKESSSTYSIQTPNIGTRRWMAPELMSLGRDELGAKTSDHDRELRHPFKADVYSFGMVCYEILTGKVPFYTISSVTEVKRMVLNGDRPILPDHCPNELQILIHSCWEEEATGRPSFVEICKTLRRLKWLPVVGMSNSSQNYFWSAHVVGGTRTMLLCERGAGSGDLRAGSRDFCQSLSEFVRLTKNRNSDGNFLLLKLILVKFGDLLPWMQKSKNYFW